MIAVASEREPASPRFVTADERWAAVMRRDVAADGRFYYSVRTTGVYCRPSCAARLARRENVAFHATCAEAEAAGFRPCKRCRPNEAALAERQAAAVAGACRLIEEAEEAPSLDALAKAAGLSRFHFHRVFKAVTGVTPKAYADAHRARRVRDELAQRETVTEAIYGAGFNSSGRFYAASAGLLGMTPTEFRAGGEGASIRFAVGECSLGSILVAATEKGVCTIHLGDDPDALVARSSGPFPEGAADRRRCGLRAAGGPGGRLRRGAGQALDLPLDVRGTAFQQRVWQALREIPVGSTATYAEIAERIGEPRAIRAVARACASNKIALAIPCHRVVRTDGALSGYRWGVERKRALLEREAAA